MVVIQEYNVQDLVSKFESRWNMKLDSSKHSQGCFFEELVFGWNINPEHAMAIVKEAVSNLQ